MHVVLNNLLPYICFQFQGYKKRTALPMNTFIHTGSNI